MPNSISAAAPPQTPLGERTALPQILSRWEAGAGCPLPNNPTPLSAMAGATDFKVGYKTGFASGTSEKKFFVPPLFQMWGYKQANTSRGLLNILKFAVWLSH